MTTREYALLEHLGRRQDAVVGRADIAEHVWDERYEPFSNVIDVYVQRLPQETRTGGRAHRDPHAPRRGLSTGSRRSDRPGAMTLSIRWRLTLSYRGAVAALLAAVSFSLFVLQNQMHVLRLDAELLRLNSTIASVLQNELDEGLAPMAAAEDALGEARVVGRDVAILRSDGAVLSLRGSPRVHASAPIAAADRIWSTPEFRIVSRVSPPVPAGFIVVAAAPSGELADERNEVLEALSLVIPGALIVAAAGAWWVAGRALRPTATMAAEAQRITDHTLDARLTVGRDDELGRVATAFNGLVDRLASALTARRDFLADVSHELRTPVSIARAAADVALSQPTRAEPEYRESLTVISGQMLRLTRMVGDLLTLARSDVTDWPIVAHDFYLDELLHEVERAMRLPAEERRVTLVTRSPRDVQITGDEQLLRQMLFTWSRTPSGTRRPGARCTWRRKCYRSELRITIQDTGTGIPEGLRDRLFERFVRIEGGESPRLGLGLAIARRIVRVHHGDVELVATGPDGSTFRVTLPTHGVATAVRAGIAPSSLG